jgi:hypothetical protein
MTRQQRNDPTMNEILEILEILFFIFIGICAGVAISNVLGGLWMLIAMIWSLEWEARLK